MQCDVDVVSWRERRVFASVAVAADVDTVWRIITDYERLADFVPNLVHRSAFPIHRRISPFIICELKFGENFVQWKDSVPARGQDMAGAEGAAASALLAHRGPRRAGSPGGPGCRTCRLLFTIISC